MSKRSESKWLEGFVPVSEEHQRHQARFAKEPFDYMTVEEQETQYAYGRFRAWHRKLQDADSSVEKAEDRKT